MTEIREDMLKVKRMMSEVEIILGKREGESKLVNKLIDAQNLLTYCMSRLENVIIPPCEVGDTVYYAGIDTPIKFTVIGFSKGRMYDCSVADYEEFVDDNDLNVDEWYVHLDSFCGLKQTSPLSSFGKRLFLGDDAEKEAKKALAKRNCDIAQNIESCEDCGFCERDGASDG